MKNIRTLFFVFAVKKVFSLIALTAFLLVLNTSPLMAEEGPVTKSEVIEYLKIQHITSAACNEIPDSYDWISDNSDGSRTRVFVQEGIITGHENIDI